MHIADYLVLGLLIAFMLEAAAVVLSRSKNRGRGKRRGVNKQTFASGFPNRPQKARSDGSLCKPSPPCQFQSFD
jgi:hypothetical protein